MPNIFLTEKLIESGKSQRGGWSKEQAKLLGVPWPLKAGWKRRLCRITIYIDEDIARRFVAMKDNHLKE